MRNLRHVNGVFASLLLGVAFAQPVMAHAELVSSVPPAVEAEVTELRLTFSERIELALSDVTVTAADGTEIATGDIGLDPADEAAVVVPLEAPLAPGEYTVDWTVVSGDGHKVEGNYKINIAP